MKKGWLRIMYFILITITIIIIIELFGVGANVRKVMNQNEEIIELLKQLNDKK